MIDQVLQRSVNLIPWSVRTRIKDLPLVALVQRWMFTKFLSGRQFLHVINAGPAKGLHYPVNLPMDKLVWAGTYETAFADAIARSVSPGDVCYDIGGYRGFFSGVFGLAGARLVVTFEPFSENCEQLNSLARNNPNLPLQIERIALGNLDGFVEFKVMPEASMGKLVTSPFQPDATGICVVKVPTRKVDSLALEGTCPPPQVVKIDVEGAEVGVLQGAMNTLRNHSPRLFIEAHSHALSEECATLLKNLDYSVTVLETGLAPNPKNDPEVCHLIATPNAINLSN